MRFRNAIPSVRRQRGFILDPFKFGAGATPGIWDAANKDADVSLSGADLVASITASDFGSVLGTTARDASLNRYFEVTMAGADVQSLVGIGRAAADKSTFPGGTSAAASYGYQPSTNDAYLNGSTTSTDYVSAGLITGFDIDIGAGTMRIIRPGMAYAVAFTGLSGTFYPMWGPGTSGAGTRTATLNSGGSAFAYGLPSGATAWGGTWNSGDKSASVTLSGSDLSASTTASTGGVRGTQSRASGRYYFEITTSGADANQAFGIGNASADIAFFPGNDANGWAYYAQSATKYTNGSATAIAQATSIVIGCWLNAGDLKWVVEGMAGAAIATGLSGDFHAMWGAATATAGTRTGTINAAGPFAYAAATDAGATAWS